MTEVCGNGFDDDCDGSGAVAGGSCWIEGTLAVSSGEAVIFSMGSSTHLGAVVSTGADVDSDGNDDWAFGAPEGGTGGLVHFDGIPTSGVYTTTSFGGGVAGNAAGDQLGSSVVLGDFNNDGVGDLFAGAPGQDDSAGEAGAGYLFFGPLVGGRTLLSSSADAFLFGVSTNEFFGVRATRLGDQDGDGAVDIAVASRANSFAGAVTVVSGITSSVSASAGSLPQLSGASPMDKFGDALDGRGDVDGDGIQDLLVGAPASDPAGIPSAGAAVLYFGPITVSGTAGDGVSFTGSAMADYVGASVSIGGDVDGDGYDDLLIGSTAGSTSGSVGDGG
ncbi:MAG: integrin alpha, partial [Myxococcota bacterium]|nr:integrin alpha [Myxococcota bacterium]